MAEDKKNVKARRPSALKRDLQSDRRRVKNKTYRSTVNSAIKAFEQCLVKNDATAAKEKLSQVASLMDKGVKKGIFPKNKASRTKSNLAVRLPA